MNKRTDQSIIATPIQGTDWRVSKPAPFKTDPSVPSGIRSPQIFVFRSNISAAPFVYSLFYSASEQSLQRDNERLGGSRIPSREVGSDLLPQSRGSWVLCIPAARLVCFDSAAPPPSALKKAGNAGRRAGINAGRESGVVSFTVSKINVDCTKPDESGCKSAVQIVRQGHPGLISE